MKPSASLLLAFALLPCFVSAQTWTKVGTGTDGKVGALSPFRGNMAVGGSFTLLNEFERVNAALVREYPNGEYAYPASHSDAFNKRASTAIENGTEIHAFAEFGARLHVGGYYFNPGYLAEVGIGYFEDDTATGNAQFHGYSHQLQPGERVRCMKAFDNKLFFGGNFTNLNGATGVAFIHAGDFPTPTIEPAGSNLNGTVHCLEVYNDTLYAGGWFAVSDSDTVVQTGVAAWDGTAWRAVENGPDSTVFALLNFSGMLYAGGAFGHSDSATLRHIAAWDGTAWQPVGGGFGDSTDVVFALAAYSDTLFAGGRLGGGLHNLAQLDNDYWKSVGTGTDDTVFALQAYRGRLYIAGVFQTANALICRNIVANNNGTEPTGTRETALEQSALRLFPNPAAATVNIESGKIITRCEIMDVGGRVVQSSRFNVQRPQQPRLSFNLEFSTLNLEPSPYLVRVTFEDGTTAIERLMVTRL